VKRFLKEEKGDAMMLLIFFIPLFFMVAIVVLALGSVYFAEQHARGLLERSTSVAVDVGQTEGAVRDLVFDVSESSAQTALEQRFFAAGLTEPDNGVYKYKDIYRLEGVTAEISGDVLRIRAQMVVYLPWRLGDELSTASVPLDIQSHVLFME
jgi:hypothetical protein